MIHALLITAAAAFGISLTVVLGALALVGLASLTRPQVRCGWCDSPPTADRLPHAPGCPDRVAA
jgi:hypothetical protein